MGGFVPESGRRTVAGSCLEPPGRGSKREESGGAADDTATCDFFSDAISSGGFQNEASGSGGVENEEFRTKHAEGGRCHQNLIGQTRRKGRAGRTSQNRRSKKNSLTWT
jgi:hypothetical protein